jgi:hypothetical protein
MNWQRKDRESTKTTRNAKRSKLTAEQAHRIRCQPPLIMNAVEGAAYTDTSERNFRNLAAKGVFPNIRIGRRVVWRRDALDAALATLEAKTNSITTTIVARQKQVKVHGPSIAASKKEAYEHS